MQIRRSNIRGIVAVAAAGLCATAAFAQAVINIPVFRGIVGDSGNVRLAAWGSGKADINKDARLVGNEAIRVTTQNLFSGARLDFPRAIDLGTAFKETDTYVRFQLRFPPASATGSTGGGGRPGFGGGDDGGPAGGGFPGGFGGSGTGVTSPFKHMRFLFTMADGTRYETTRTVSVPPTDDPNDYIPLSVPLAALLKKNDDNLPIPTGQGAQLKSIAVFGDRFVTFYIGEITVITDQTDIMVQTLEEQIAFVNNTLTFVADAEGGASTLKYSWDFDARDGVQEDAEGRVVNKTFAKSGTYKVTLTVSDVDGLKKPSTVSLELNVAE